MATAEGKQIYHESGMIDGSFSMFRIYELESGFLNLTLKDQKSGSLGSFLLDHDDETSLSTQLKEEKRTKQYFQALCKKVKVLRTDPENIRIAFKDLTIEDPEEKKQRRIKEEEEKKAREEQERLEREERERLLREEEERRIKEEEERKKREEELRLAREEAERQEAEMLANMTEEEKVKFQEEKLGLGTKLIDAVEDAKDIKEGEIHPQLERPEIKPNKRRGKTSRVKTFKELEEEEREREEEKKKPKEKDEIDQKWDDPFDLLAEYRKAEKQKHNNQALMAEMFGGKKALE